MSSVVTWQHLPPGLRQKWPSWASIDIASIWKLKYEDAEFDILIDGFISSAIYWTEEEIIFFRSVVYKLTRNQLRQGPSRHFVARSKGPVRVRDWIILKLFGPVRGLEFVGTRRAAFRGWHNMESLDQLDKPPTSCAWDSLPPVARALDLTKSSTRTYIAKRWHLQRRLAGNVDIFDRFMANAKRWTKAEVEFFGRDLPDLVIDDQSLSPNDHRVAIMAGPRRIRDFILLNLYDFSTALVVVQNLAQFHGWEHMDEFLKPSAVNLLTSADDASLATSAVMIESNTPNSTIIIMDQNKHVGDNDTSMSDNNEPSGDGDELATDNTELNGDGNESMAENSQLRQCSDKKEMDDILVDYIAKNHATDHGSTRTASEIDTTARDCVQKELLGRRA